MEASVTKKIKRSSIKIEPSFEKNILNNCSYIGLDSKIESTNKLIDEEKAENNIFSKKLFEKANISEIYDLLKVMNQPVTIDVNKIGKKDYYYSDIKNRAHSIENKQNILIEDQHSKECQEILHVLQMPLNDKKEDDIPFKPLLKPKKISLVGKVIIDTYNTKNYSSEYNNENENSNNFFN